MATFRVDLNTANLGRFVASPQDAVFDIEAGSPIEAAFLIAQQLGVPFRAVNSPGVVQAKLTPGVRQGVGAINQFEDVLSRATAAGTVGQQPATSLLPSTTEAPGGVSLLGEGETASANRTPSSPFQPGAFGGPVSGRNEFRPSVTSPSLFGSAAGGEGEGFVGQDEFLPPGIAKGQPFTPGSILNPDQRTAIDESRASNKPSSRPAVGDGNSPNAQQVAQLVEGLIAEGATPEEIADILESQGLADALNNPQVAGFLGETALAVIGDIKVALIEQQGAVANTLAGANPFDRTAEEDAALQALLARGGINENDAVKIQKLTAAAGINNPFALLQSGKITLDQLQNLERIAVSGGLDDPDKIFKIQEAMARGPVDNPFAFLSSGGEFEQTKQILELQNAPEMQANFLNFIGNPSAVGSAVGFGFDPFSGQGNTPFPTGPSNGGTTQNLAGDQQAFLPETGQSLSGGPQGPRNTGPESIGPLSTDFGRGQLTPPDPFVDSFNDPTLQLQRQTLPFLNGGQEEDGGFSSLGNFRGAGRNPNANELRDRSDEELQFLGGQAASRGETPSALDRRIKSNTSQGL